MAWPAYKTQLPELFRLNDQAMISLKKQLTATANRSLLADVRRETFVNQQKDLERLAADLDILILIGARAASAAVDLYDDDALDLAAEYINVRDSALALSQWINTAIADDTPLLVADDSQPDGKRFEVYTTAQTAQYRANVAAFGLTIQDAAP